MYAWPGRDVVAEACRALRKLPDFPEESEDFSVADLFDVVNWLMERARGDLPHFLVVALQRGADDPLARELAYAFDQAQEIHHAAHAPARKNRQRGRPRREPCLDAVAP